MDINFSTPVPRWISADKSGHKTIKFATNLLYLLNMCLDNYIVLCSLSDLGKYMGPCKKDLGLQELSFQLGISI